MVKVAMSVIGGVAAGIIALLLLTPKWPIVPAGIVAAVIAFVVVVMLQDLFRKW